MINYLLILLITYLGLVLGFFLSKVAWEEIYMYKKFLTWTKIGCVIGCVLALVERAPWYLLFFYLIAFFTIWFQRSTFPYALLSLLLWISYGTDRFATVGSLILLYGMAQGSLEIYGKGKKAKYPLQEILKEHSLYLLLGILPLIF